MIRVGDSTLLGVTFGPSPATGLHFETGQLGTTGYRFDMGYHNESIMGKRIKVVRGDCEVSRPVCLGQEGVITGWYDFVEKSRAEFQVILPASCYHMAIISGDNGETFYANTSWCDILS